METKMSIVFDLVTEMRLHLEDFERSETDYLVGKMRDSVNAAIGPLKHELRQLQDRLEDLTDEMLDQQKAMRCRREFVPHPTRNVSRSAPALPTRVTLISSKEVSPHK